MKKINPISKVILTLLFMSLLQLNVLSQSLGISVSNATSCVPSASNQVVCSITTSLAGTAYYTYTVSQSCGAGTSYAYGGFGATTATINVPCAGPYTLSCNAINSSSVVIGNASATGSFNTASTASISISPNNGAGCLGTTFTVSLSGASTYTTSGFFGSVSGSTVTITPTTSTCFTVTASNGLCTANSVRCFTLYTPPNISLSSGVNVCSGANTTLTPSGATNYTWSTGSTNPFIIVSPTASTCYTVTGTTQYCSGTSSAVSCVSVVPSPTLNIGLSSTSICAGSGQTLTASGATNYTWSIYMGTTTPVYTSTLSNFIINPTVAGTYSVILTGNNGSGCNVSTGINFNVIPSGNVSVPSSYTVCSGYQVGLSATGASSYLWSNSSTASIIYVTPSVSTCYTVVGNNPGCGGTSTAVTCVSVIASPSISVAGPTATSCYGSTNTYTASGGIGNSYGWMNPNTFANLGTGSVVTISSLNSLSFYVYNTATITGCNVFGNTITPSYIPSPTLNISTTGSNVCSGTNVVLTGSGANSYTWLPGNTNSNILNLNPTSAGCYTLIGTNSNGCSASAVQCIGVLPLPVVNISGVSSACPGTALSFTASGASSYVWSNSTVGNVLNVTPLSNICYSVIGTNANGCTNMASKCVTMLPTPTLSISGSNSICIGSSNTFTVSGGSTYTWNTNASTNTLNVMPNTSTNYTVVASHILNNCTSTATVALTVYTNCAIVWPGDANRDGVVSSSDVFEIGLANGSSGAARSGASNTWSGQFANAWSGNVSSGWNKAHADCNGDGNITAADTVAIFNNFSLTHAFKNTNSTSGIDLFLIPQNSEAFGGVWNVIDVVLGDVSNTQSQIYGAAFDIDYDQSMIMPDSVKLIYTSSFLNNGNQNIQFRKNQFTNGMLYAASVRTDHSDVSGFSKIGELWVKLRSDLADNSSFVFGISNGQRTNASGNMATLSTSGSMNLNLNNNATGVKSNSLKENLVNFYPNPANQSLIIKSNMNEKTGFRLFDVTGRCVMTGEVIGVKTFDISALQQGVYVFEFDTKNGKIQKKLIKE